MESDSDSPPLGYLETDSEEEGDDDGDLSHLGAAATKVKFQSVKQKSFQMVDKEANKLAQDFLGSCQEPSSEVVPASRQQRLKFSYVGADSGTRVIQQNFIQVQQQFEDVEVKGVRNLNIGGTQNINRSELSQKILERTLSQIQSWNKNMVNTSGLQKVLMKLKQGSSWITIRGSPGEGKSTVAYMALEELHKNGREVFQVISPEEFSEVSMSSSRPVIMLDDVFGNLEFDQVEWSRWKAILIQAVKIKEHRSLEKEGDTEYEAEKQEITSRNGDVTVILVGRGYVLKSATWDMGRMADYFVQEAYVVDMSHSVERDIQERLAIWNSISASSGTELDQTTIDKICHIKVPHGFPHVCRLFVTIRKNDPTITAENFFNAPLIFLNQTMANFMHNKHKRDIFKAMIKGNGKVHVRNLDEDTADVARGLVGTYLKEKDGILTFDHPSIFDSVANILCELYPVFVITSCDLSFIHERLRLQPSHDKHPVTPSISGLVVYISRSCIQDLAKRFAIELEKNNLLQVLSHQAFTDPLVLKEVFSSKLSLRKLSKLTDSHSGDMFLALVPSNKSPQLLMFIESQKDIKLKQSDINTVLYGVCKYAASDVLMYLKQAHPTLDINVVFANEGKSPIMIAAETRNSQFIEHVLSLKPDLNARDTTWRKKFVLHYLCENGLVSAVELVVDNGVDINLKCRFEHTPLYYACRSNQVDVVRMLLNRKAQIDDSVVREACRFESIDVVKLFIQRGISVNKLLEIACISGRHVQLLNLLIEKGASVNKAKVLGSSALHSVCALGYPEVVQYFLDHGADIETKDWRDETPLHASSRRRKRECVDVLLKSGANVNVEDENGQTPLHKAVYSKILDYCKLPDVSVCQSLIQHGANINKQESNGNTPLHLLCHVGRWTNINQKRPFNPASRYEDVFREMVMLLVDSGADVNILNQKKKPALHGWCKKLVESENQMCSIN